MNFGTALAEFAHVLAVAASALEDLAEREGRLARNDRLNDVLAETKKIAHRLSELGDQVELSRSNN